MYSQVPLFGLLFALLISLSISSPPLEWRRQFSPRAAQLRRYPRDAPSGGSCAGASTSDTKAPHKNIFLGLTNEEAVGVTEYLHSQSSLNLTAVVNATAWDNTIILVELLQPNKSDALTFLDRHGPEPKRYARARIQFGATKTPFTQEFQVGPLPVSGNGTVNTNSTVNGTTYGTTNGTLSGTSKLQPLNYPFNRGEGRFRAYDIDLAALLGFTIQIGSEIADITQTLFNATWTGNPENDTIAVASNGNFLHEGGRVSLWWQFVGYPQGTFLDPDILFQGLEFKTDITGRDPSKWSVTGWYYNNFFSPSLDEFRKAIPGLKTGKNVDGPWGATDQAGPKLPRDELYPPVTVQPDGPRYAVDHEAKYVEWMDFSFYISFNWDVGVTLQDIKYKGERIIYQLALQEAVAHYASADPFQSTTAYLDSYGGMGTLTYELVPGFDCPIHASYMNVTYYNKETTHTHPNAICFFEHDTEYPIQRHTTPTYVSATKNIAFVMRSIATVGNYDYIWDYEFYLDGSIFVTVRASGYIQGAFWVNDPEYGFHIHDYLSGSLHDHVMNYKLDLDVHGTKNSLMKVTVIPSTENYSWSDKPRRTMKIDRSFITSEANSKIDYAANGVDYYSIVNKDKPNQYGEYPGYRVMPMSTIHATMKRSSNLGPSINWAYNDLYCVQHKDTEPRSAYPYNGLDSERPVVDFGKFFDGDSLDQEDLVLYFNLGMHHVPHTGDLPNTVTTTARSSLAIMPQNYLLSDPSRQTVHQVRLNFSPSGPAAMAMMFGAKQPTCAVDLGSAFPDLSTYSGEVIVPKFPYDPTAVSIVGPGAG